MFISPFSFLSVSNLSKTKPRRVCYCWVLGEKIYHVAVLQFKSRGVQGNAF